MFVDHIAILTADLRRQSDALPTFCTKQPIETFPAEGTQEQYLTLSARSPSLLLIQAIAEGPYRRALRKRGPGLHHIGFKTPALEAQVSQLCAQGLQLHPISSQTSAQGVSWLYLPGMPFLIELAEDPDAVEHDLMEIGIPTASGLPDIVADLSPKLGFYVVATDSLELKTGKQHLVLPCF